MKPEPTPRCNGPSPLRWPRGSLPEAAAAGHAEAAEEIVEGIVGRDAATRQLLGHADVHHGGPNLRHQIGEVGQTVSSGKRRRGDRRGGVGAAHEPRAWQNEAEHQQQAAQGKGSTGRAFVMISPVLRQWTARSWRWFFELPGNSQTAGTGTECQALAQGRSTDIIAGLKRRRNDATAALGPAGGGEARPDRW